MSCGGNKSKKTCHDKSCQRFYNNNAQAFTADTALQLQIAGAKVVDSGISIETQPLSYTTLKTGLYHIVADVTANSAAVGAATLQIYMDGVPLPCTLRSVTLVIGNTEIHTETDLQLTGCCCDVEHNFTFVLIPTVAGTVTQACTGVLKLA